MSLDEEINEIISDIMDKYIVAESFKIMAELIQEENPERNEGILSPRGSNELNDRFCARYSQRRKHR